MIRQLSAFAAVLGLVSLLPSTLNGDYSIVHPLSGATILAYSDIQCDGGCPEGEQVKVELWNNGSKICAADVAVGPFSETWAKTFTAPYYGWIEGNGWTCKLRSAEGELMVTRIFSVIGFGV